MDAENQLSALSVDDEPVTEAERLRVVHTLIAAPDAEGGAGITPGTQGWDYVESVFPLRDPEFNKATSFVVKLMRRNGYIAGQVSGSSMTRISQSFAITTAKKSPCILRSRNSTVSHLFLYPLWVYFLIFSFRVTIGCMALDWAFGLYFSNMHGSGNSAILLYNGV